MATSPTDPNGSATQWYDYPITQGHDKDDGVDLGTPDLTPVFFPIAGTVVDASYHDYGGQVVIKQDGGPWDDYFIHLNDIYVHPGQHVSAGEIIGNSGGGVGDKVLHGGQVQPAQSQSWYDGHSSGPHTEFGMFYDTVDGRDVSGNMGQFNQGWGNPSRQHDPTSMLDLLKREGLQGIFRGGNPQPNGTDTAIAPVSIPAIPGPRDWAKGVLSAVGIGDPGGFAGRVVVGTVGVLLVLGGVFLALQPEVEQATQDVGKAAAAAGKVAAL